MTGFVLLAGLLLPQGPDSLMAAKVIADRDIVISHTDTIPIANTTSISDALSTSPGLYIADYGGLAGLKNVSLRGLGSPHATIYLDGVRVGNVQSGQADLGMLDLDNLGSAIIDYARNSISFVSSYPAPAVFAPGANSNPRSAAHTIRLRAGSFGTCEPSARMDFRLNDKVCLSASGSGVISKGDFPLGDGTLRENNDIEQVRGAIDTWGLLDGGNWHTKAYWNASRRGTPGSIYYPSTDRQNDCNTFLQASLSKQFTPLYLLNVSAKAAYDDLKYHSSYGDSRYSQSEAQLNTSHKFSLNSRMDACLTADFLWDGLESNLYDAGRTTLFSSALASFHPEKFRADLALEYCGSFDREGKKRNILSPSAELCWNALKGLDVLAFARRSYRTPTFNELYYPGYGNPELKSEDATLTDLGLEYNFRPIESWLFRTRADGFFNYLKNKIVSAPSTEDPNIWLPYNIGIVSVLGADIKASAEYSGKELKASFHALYSFQDAKDKTTYGHQVPYISKHTLCLGANASLKGWAADLNFSWRAGRYDSYGRMPDYNTLDFTVGKDISLPNSRILTLKLFGRNLLDCRYELAGGYPMPGRAFYTEISFKF